MTLLASVLALGAIITTSQIARADESSSSNGKSQGSETHSADRSASNKSGTGNSTVPNGGSTQGGHNPEKGSNQGATSGSQYQTPNK